ncbi:MAG TPA: polysaccharide biosynthesis/export family protein, partial [Caulobacteraceae bacterium]
MRYISASLAGVVAAACLSSVAQADGTAASAMPAAQLPPPDLAGAIIAEQQAYRIGAFDALDISVFQVDLLTRSVQVDATGHIEFPMIGDVTAAGKTAKELGDEIAARLDKAYLRSPQVTVVVKDSASQKYTVEGAVKSSGVFPVVGHMTLLRAIATAQGVDPDAKLRDVV